MPALRSDFYGSLRHMLKLSQETLLTDTFPPNEPHNIGARILRHGLAVSAFSSLEKYIEARFEMLMADFAGAALGYANFSDELKRFVTIDAMTGLVTRIGFHEASVRQAYADQHIQRIAAYNSNPASYTAFGFSPKGSNVSAGDISKAFSACGAAKAWTKLSGIASAIGSTRVNLEMDYTNLARTRHRSAHNPASNVPTNDLKTHIEIAILIGIAIDVLILGIGRAIRTARTASDLKSKIDSLSYTYRYLDLQIDSTWVERASLSGRAIKRHPTETAAIAVAKARTSQSIVIVRDTQQVPLAIV